MTCKRLEDEGMLADLGGSLDVHVEQCGDCRARRDEYARLARTIADGESGHRLPPRWQERVRERLGVARAVRRRRAAVVAGVSIVAVAAIVALLIGKRREPAPSPRLAVSVVDHGAWRGPAHPGDELRARALQVGSSHVEIRVYREARELAARCGGGEDCRDAQGPILRWRIPEVGTYWIVLFVSPAPIRPTRGTLDQDLHDALAAGARVAGMETLRVD